ncbi:MAG: bifunctional class I SAM-dependent methyltransferase/glycosyltransferase family 2 protein [Anaerolineae bacterium]|nr:bifunctional class I SAM-dependent methyltransferase/glycosyltransferase family 2 protein [Anaerolineae bacterium]MCI0611089.1 bifunctional class I SAM-dependent methyltransferase/glycosyltransferase family 2 protein [Anaerolineae bacterium]
MNLNTNFEPAGNIYQQARIAHWDSIARKLDQWRGMGQWYHKRLEEIYCFLVSPGLSVLEIGCSDGNLLAALKPSRGIGVDFSSEMIRRAKERHPELEFIHADAHDLSEIKETFDVIILSDLVNDLWDVQRVLEQLQPLCTERTRIILNFYSRLWQTPLNVARSLNLATSNLYQNWLTREDMNVLLLLAGLEPIRNTQEVLWPLPLGSLANRFIVRFWPFHHLAISNFMIARTVAKPVKEPGVSIIIPARNESGNIKAIFERTPQMGRETELVFVEGHSKDDTYEAIKREIASHPSTPSLLLQQTGIGKADAVRLGFSKAKGEVLMILDADLTVPPEDLPRFYDALVSGKGEFINGVRLVYPMEKEAMQTLNFFGNKFFSLAFSWMLGQSIKDTLCGTKVLWKRDYERIAANRSYFGDFDPFGDYDLIFGAAKLNLKIIDLPIRYRERTYGSTNISRWKHGLLLMRMVAFAARRIKFT